jgi:hypothetical protein
MRKMTIEFEEQDVEELIELFKEMNKQIKLTQDMVGVLLARAYKEKGSFDFSDTH